MDRHPAGTSPAARKAALRQELLTRRRTLPVEPAERAAVEALTGPGLAAGRVAAYASVGAEPSTAALLAALAGRVEVLLPVLLPDGDLDWAVADGPLSAAPRGLLEPTGPRQGRDAVRDCPLVVVPAVAVGHDGTRLGRGGGSYDRALRRVAPGALVVALLHDGELRDDVPAEPHDVRVGAVVTPATGLLHLPSGGSAGMSP